MFPYNIGIYELLIGFIISSFTQYSAFSKFWLVAYHLHTANTQDLLHHPILIVSLSFDFLNSTLQVTFSTHKKMSQQTSVLPDYLVPLSDYEVAWAAMMSLHNVSAKYIAFILATQRHNNSDYALSSSTRARYRTILAGVVENVKTSMSAGSFFNNASVDQVVKTLLPLAVEAKNNGFINRGVIFDKTENNHAKRSQLRQENNALERWRAAREKSNRRLRLLYETGDPPPEKGKEFRARQRELELEAMLSDQQAYMTLTLKTWRGL